MRAWDLCRACGLRPLPPYAAQDVCLVCELQGVGNRDGAVGQRRVRERKEKKR